MLSLGTHYIVFYCDDGSVIEYDLIDPRVPLPRFRSLVVQPWLKPAPTTQTRQKADHCTAPALKP